MPARPDDAPEDDDPGRRLRRDLARRRGVLDPGRDALSSALDPPRGELEELRALLSQALAAASAASPELAPLHAALDGLDLQDPGAAEAVEDLRARIEDAGQRALALRFSLFETRLARRGSGSRGELEP